MAENNDTGKKINLNAPGKSAADSVVTPIKDPMSFRDTDTGNLKRLTPGKAKKTIKLKPLTAKSSATRVTSKMPEDAQNDMSKTSAADVKTATPVPRLAGKTSAATGKQTIKLRPSATGQTKPATKEATKVTSEASETSKTDDKTINLSFNGTKPGDAAKPAASKSAVLKPGGAKPAASKSAVLKPASSKSGVLKPGQPKPASSKSAVITKKPVTPGTAGEESAKPSEKTIHLKFGGKEKAESGEAKATKSAIGLKPAAKSAIGLKPAAKPAVAKSSATGLKPAQKTEATDEDIKPGEKTIHLEFDGKEKPEALKPAASKSATGLKAAKPSASSVGLKPATKPAVPAGSETAKPVSPKPLTPATGLTAKEEGDKPAVPAAPKPPGGLSLSKKPGAPETPTKPAEPGASAVLKAPGGLALPKKEAGVQPPGGGEAKLGIHKDEEKAAGDEMFEKELKELKDPGGKVEPGIIMSLLALVSMILVGGAVALCTIQFLNQWQEQKIVIPGLENIAEMKWFADKADSPAKAEAKAEEKKAPKATEEKTAKKKTPKATEEKTAKKK